VANRLVIEVEFVFFEDSSEIPKTKRSGIIIAIRACFKPLILSLVKLKK